MPALMPFYYPYWFQQSKKSFSKIQIQAHQTQGHYESQIKFLVSNLVQADRQSPKEVRKPADGSDELHYINSATHKP